MITVLLGCVFVVALATACLMGLVMLQGAEYDQWVREFEENGGISWGLDKDPVFGAASYAQHVGEVLDGNQVVSHTVLGERRARPR